MGNKLADGVLQGSRLALARAITAVENATAEAQDIMKELYPHAGQAYVIGITGTPGAGKSTLTDKLAKEFRKAGKTVGIIAVDPTSPFSGGAILGDRIRMGELTLDQGVFIRSMGTRGSLGGLSRKTAEAVKILDAFGKDVIFIETVGVGQSEVDIVKAADTTVVVLVPGLGDDIQAIKAGILEIGDIFAINKADREGVERLHTEIEMMLDLAPLVNPWRPPVMRTIANQGDGVAELVEKLCAHFTYLQESGALEQRRRERTKNELLELITMRIEQRVLGAISSSGLWETMLTALGEKKTDPYRLVEQALEKIMR